MTHELLKDISECLARETGIVAPLIPTEQHILELLCRKIEDVIKQGPGVFYTLMYRLDIPENKVVALTGGNDVAMEVARLVYDRQLAKSRSRLHYRQSPRNIEPDLEW